VHRCSALMLRFLLFLLASLLTSNAAVSGACILIAASPCFSACFADAAARQIARSRRGSKLTDADLARYTL
jgi:hypothetical protein